MNIPKTMNIFGMKYKIVFVEDLKDENQNLCGCVDGNNKVIYLRSKMKKQL